MKINKLLIKIHNKIKIPLKKMKFRKINFKNYELLIFKKILMRNFKLLMKMMIISVESVFICKKIYMQIYYDIFLNLLFLYLDLDNSTEIDKLFQNNKKNIVKNNNNNNNSNINYKNNNNN